MCKKNYDWQKRGFNKIDELMARDTKEIVPLNACVGSGKTNEMLYAIKHFIDLNPDKKTVSFFVAPTIRLVQQQKAAAEKFFKGESPVNTVDYTVRTPNVEECSSYIFCKEWDCTVVQDGADRQVHSDICANTQHLILFICADSFIGTYKANGFEKDNSLFWEGKLSYWEKSTDPKFHREIGILAMDEAHNYSNSQSKILGREIAKSEDSTESTTPSVVIESDDIPPLEGETA